MPTKVKIAVPVVLLLVAVGGFLYWFFRDDAPDEVDLGAAVDAVDDGDDDVAGDGGDGEPVQVEGTWVVQADPGSFNYDESDQGTYVGFRVEEQLVRGAATAVGRTPVVEGELTIEGTTLTEALVTADLSEITTNESMRDSRVRSALSTGEFPEATFTLTEPVELGEAATSGGPVSVTATGELTIKGITRPITIDIEGQVAGSTLVVVGSTEITFADWDVQVPSAPIVLSAEDHGVLEVQLLLRKP